MTKLFFLCFWVGITVLNLACLSLAIIDKSLIMFIICFFTSCIGISWIVHLAGNRNHW